MEVTGVAALDSEPGSRLGRTGRASLSLLEVGRGAAERPELEAFVSAAFAHRHAATVKTFMPTLLAFHDSTRRLRGVVGLRSAATERLYLEQYLDTPIEAAIAAATGQAVRRCEIIEVGNLAGASCRMAVRMVAQLPAHLMSRDFRWIVFTATSAVRQIVLGFGAPLAELARADGTRVAAGGDQWGSYYETDPRVFVGHLPDSRRISAFMHGDRSH